MIVIIDYGLGNLDSFQNMIRYVGGEAMITADPRVVSRATKLILPGVGAFDYGMKKLKEVGLVEVLSEKVLMEKMPILCVCLGMQLMALRSEEGVLSGLGWIDAKVEKFKTNGLKVPHMGWNSVSLKRSSPLFSGATEELRYYFAHSYHLVCQDPADIVATSCYGVEFVTVVQKENVYGTQFHPEKSHKYGMELIKNFVRLA